ncbi:hypothetical protein PHYBLDRAFT_162026 [Phycomyces blakesleeanus NRRL 1555(-)]|uniref:Uncharacterized protein n=1 Tax=Phycomyces blakesleeanus (strain ATCC 8743b / DSM 1359 / FGSC 10004 / NBRC 33097 / NRRL 1555) TaxID=763407 RepID=A0A162VB96_PHYB8|nr:hypothetical protein PHYBLDRAFT_162026 [Phycomyces blakesleeanus NRRL 1555(-)]OAD81412.1 hypothetical protein PHYBLDRAFT_162026 [Phycomyces blakesleeanus NRRL 1555(-)]|eukprot:XP_018299452.1 hypothetical protein PHYBLDRAFT_162026 [Phycomyces blakesleeanus NRRL 1555(-)]
MSTPSAIEFVSHQEDDNQSHSWMKPDGGKDGLSSIDRLQYFLLKDDADNLRKYLGGFKNGKKVKVSKTRVINDCCQYFDKQGVKRTSSQIKSKLTYLITKQYPIAFKAREDSTMRISEEEMSQREKDELEVYLNDICPNFTQMRKVLGESKAKSPAVCNTTTPLDLNKAQDMSKDEDGEDGENDGGDEASESSKSCKDQEEQGADVSNEISSQREAIVQSNSESSTSEHSDASAYSGKRRPKFFGKIVKNTAKRSVKSIEDIGHGIKEFNDARISLLESKYEEELKNQKEKLQKELQCEQRVKGVILMAKTFDWSEEKTKNELEEVYNQYLN